MSSATNTDRRCGACTLCCRVLGVDELAKPANQGCVHAGPGGCAIYAARPRSCRTYRCHWLEDPTIPAAFRPDRVGVVLTRIGQDLVATVDPDRPALPAALAAWLERQATRVAVLLVRGAERRPWGSVAQGRPSVREIVTQWTRRPEWR